MVFLSCGCEKDILENYRKNFTGNYSFTTIREDMTMNPPGIIDTIVFDGAIESIYSNRNDMIQIEFLSGKQLDVAVGKDGQLSMPSTGSGGEIESLRGSFTDASTRVVFDYQITSGDNYSVNHRVEGIKQ
jgi:hypothetical protein